LLVKKFEVLLLFLERKVNIIQVLDSTSSRSLHRLLRGLYYITEKGLLFLETL